MNKNNVAADTWGYINLVLHVINLLVLNVLCYFSRYFQIKIQIDT